MWKFWATPEEKPVLFHTVHATSANNCDNVTLLFTVNKDKIKVVQGRIYRTEYDTWKVELCGSVAEYFKEFDALQCALKKWDSWYD